MKVVSLILSILLLIASMSSASGILLWDSVHIHASLTVDEEWLAEEQTTEELSTQEGDPGAEIRVNDLEKPGVIVITSPVITMPPGIVVSESQVIPVEDDTTTAEDDEDSALEDVIPEENTEEN